MDTLLQDLRYASRSLRKAPVFTVAATLCLAIGIAANVTVFSPVNTLLLRPLPFAHPDRLVALHMTQLRDGRAEGPWSYADYRDVGDGAGVFASTALVGERSWNLGGIAEPERVHGARITASLFPTLGLQPQLGRPFAAEEDLTGGVLLLSDALWRRRFAADSAVVGRKVLVNGVPYTVVGVMPPRIRFPETAELWLPLEPGEGRDRRDWRNYEMIGRLAPGASVEQAEAKLRGIAKRLADRHPETNAGWGAWIQPYRERFVGEVRPVMLIMLGAVGFVLLIACANVANLLLARSSARQKEFAVRMALGASRRRVVRQLLTESILLSVLGGLLGTLLGVWGLDGIQRLLPPNLPFWMVFDVDRTVLLVTVGVTVATGLLFGLAPALHASSPSLTATLKDGGRGTTEGARRGRLRGGLVVSEIALSLVLLAGATLMIQSFLRTQHASLGFSADRTLTFETSLQGPRYEGDSLLAGRWTAIAARLGGLPGVERVGAVYLLPVGSCCSFVTFFPEGSQLRRVDGPTSQYNIASPGLFAAIGMTVREGRAFAESDGPHAPRVAAVNRTFAERAWPGKSAIGRRFRLSDPNDSTLFTVVAVVADVVQRDVRRPHEPQLYLPLAQAPARTMTLVVRTLGDPLTIAPAVRRELRAFDAELPVAHLRTMPEVVRQRSFQPRVYGLMFGVFAAAALLLASVGLYGVVSYSVAQRTHEIGVRVALGALPGDVLGLVVRYGVRLTVVGLAIGLPAALLLTRLLRGTLYGVSASDPATFVGISLLLAAVALLAAYMPARRATRVDPMEALRSE